MKPLKDMETISISTPKKSMPGRKGYGLWGNWPGITTPLIYFRKPSTISQKDFDKVVENIRLNTFD